MRRTKKCTGVAGRAFPDSKVSRRNPVILDVRDEEGYADVTDRDPSARSHVGTCERCGEYREGRSKLMIYRLMERFPASPIARQFFCNRCLRVMRIYAFVGFSLLVILLGSLIGAVLWVRFVLTG
jgi:hypothetical protein